MDAKTGMYAYLQSKSLLTDLISTRLYPEGAVQGATLPYVTYETNDDQHGIHLRGPSAIADYYFTFTVYAATSDDRDAVAEALRNILHSRRNITLTGSISMRVAILETRHDSITPPPDGTEIGVFTSECDFTIILFETVPTLP